MCTCLGQVSPDEMLVAWGEDRKGNEAYVLRVRDIATGKDVLQRPVEVCLPTQPCLLCLGC